jgi:hypothetical protein
MIVGHNHRRLEKRITAAMFSGIPYPREAYFLQQMSERIIHKGENTWLSDLQAKRLFAILTRCEKKPSPKRPSHTPRPRNPQPTSKRPEAFHIEECFVDPRSPCKFVDTVPDRIVPPAPTPAQPAQASESLATREPDIGSIIRRVIAGGENFRKRRERIERQRLKSSSTSSPQDSTPKSSD